MTKNSVLYVTIHPLSLDLVLLCVCSMEWRQCGKGFSFNQFPIFEVLDVMMKHFFEYMI